MCVIRSIPAGGEIDVELDELDRTVGCELSNNREQRNEDPGCRQDPVVGTARNAVLT